MGCGFTRAVLTADPVPMGPAEAERLPPTAGAKYKQISLGVQDRQPACEPTRKVASLAKGLDSLRRVQDDHELREILQSYYSISSTDAISCFEHCFTHSSNLQTEANSSCADALRYLTHQHPLIATGEMTCAYRRCRPAAIAQTRNDDTRPDFGRPYETGFDYGEDRKA